MRPLQKGCWTSKGVATHRLKTARCLKQMTLRERGHVVLCEVSLLCYPWTRSVQHLVDPVSEPGERKRRH